MKNLQITVYIEKDEDGIYIGSVPSIPGCHAEGQTKEEMMKNLNQVLKLCIRNTDSDLLEKNKFVGIQKIEVAHA